MGILQSSACVNFFLCKITKERYFTNEENVFSIWNNLNKINILLPVLLALQICFLLKTKQKQENTFFLNIHKKEVLIHYIYKLWNSPAQDIVKARGINGF